MLHSSSATLGLLCLINFTIMINPLGMLIPSSLPPNHGTLRLFISEFSEFMCYSEFLCGCVSCHGGHSYLQWMSASLLNVFGPSYRQFALCSTLDRAIIVKQSLYTASFSSLEFFLRDVYITIFLNPAASISTLESSISSRLLGLGPACHVIIAADSNSPGLLIASYWAKVSAKLHPKPPYIYANRDKVVKSLSASLLSCWESEWSLSPKGSATLLFFLSVT